MRDGRKRRVARETAIDLAVSLDNGRGLYRAPTGLRFFDHMLEAFCLYSGIAVTGEARSLDGIDHHIVEDVAIVLGGASRTRSATAPGLRGSGPRTSPWTTHWHAP